MTQGGHQVPALQKKGSCAFLCDVRVPKFWYNSYFIVTMDVLNPENPKGVPKKIQSIIFDAGVKNLNCKVEAIVQKF